MSLNIYIPLDWPSSWSQVPLPLTIGGLPGLCVGRWKAYDYKSCPAHVFLSRHLLRWLSAKAVCENHLGELTSQPTTEAQAPSGSQVPAGGAESVSEFPRYLIHSSAGEALFTEYQALPLDTQVWWIIAFQKGLLATCFLAVHQRLPKSQGT